MIDGRLTPEQLDDEIERGAIDTVLVAFCDLQGRLVGKRVTGRYWRDELASGRRPLHACNYLLAVDVEMTPLPGYAFANWEQGYGDFATVPDLSTLRRVPWLDATALVLCDLADDETGEPVEVAPRRILARQVERAAALGYVVNCGTELEFFLFRESYEEAATSGYGALTPHSSFIEDYHILQTTRDEYLIRRIRNGMEGAGVPVEFSKGEAGRGQHEINLVYADALEMADRHAVYKNGAKEIASLAGRAITFMAKYDETEVGSSCHVHSSVWDAGGRTSLMAGDDPRQLSATGAAWLAGLVSTGRELAVCHAPTVNSYKRYQPESWAPTALAWGRDNRTCGFRVVGRGSSLRVESRVPGADVNPYLSLAATIAAGLHGIDEALALPPECRGNAYEATDVERVPHTLHDAIDAFAGSEVAREAFGAEVHDHLLNTVRQEQAAFDRAVTDWERRRNFEQY